jgi:hypothetical protein
MIPGGAYVVLAAAISFAGLGLYAKIQYHRAEAAISGFASYKAQAESESAKLRAKAAEVRIEVVTKYVDRVKTIRVPEPVEVVREIEIIRDSGCVLPGEFRVLHDSAARGGTEAPAGANDSSSPVDCATAIEVIRENYKRSSENSAQLGALQEWAASVSAP